MATVITTGNQHSCGIDDVGGLWCWGSNAAGQLGLDNVEETNVPLRLSSFPLESTQTTLLTFLPSGTYQLGQPVTFRAEVSASSGTPGGQGSFRNEGVEFATAPLDANGRAEVTFSNNPLG